LGEAACFLRLQPSADNRFSTGGRNLSEVLESDGQ
jgi:hypothetical protein